MEIAVRHNANVLVGPVLPLRSMSALADMTTYLSRRPLDERIVSKGFQDAHE
jgi:hypothetical protein